MKRSIFYLFLLGVGFIYGQSTIVVQSFESSGDTWTPITFSTPPCTVGNDIWDYSTGLSSISPNNGSQFWGIRDLDGSCGGTGFETISLPNVDISTFSNVQFSFDYNAIGFDNNDDLKYELFYDNVSQGEVIVVDGVGGNSDNTNGWLTETVSIPGSVTNARVILSARSNANNDRAGFDNVLLTGSSASTLANDNCSTAITLAVGTDNTQNVVTGTNVGATTSGQLPNPTCANYQGNDVWYTAQVPANGIITVETQNAGSNIDTAIEIYSGSCTGLTQLACHDDINYPSNLYSKIDLTGLPNTTIYIRVWAWSNASSGNFNIVAYSPPPPANNDCVDAQSLTVGTSNTQNIVTGTNVNATDSGVTLNPNCDSYQGGDVWFTTQVPPSGILNIETSDAGGITDTGLAVYTGSCGSLTQIDCDADSGPGFFSVINLTGLANTTVYIRVWEYQNNNFGEFNIVAYSPECPLTTRWNNSGWNNGAPNSFTTAIINADYDTAVDGSFESCDCQINNNDVVNIRANDYITVHNDLTVNGTLEVRHEGSLVMTDDNGTVSVSGTLNVHKTSTPFKQYDYSYWSSSTANETIGSALATSVANRIYRFDTTIYNELTTNGWTPVGASTVMGPGTGYIAMGPTSGTFPQTQDIIFDGTVNNGIIQSPIDLSADSTKDYEDWNLIGNPYPSAINADLLLNNALNTSVVGGTIYLWTHNTARNTNQGEQDYNSNDYATYTFGTGGVAASTGGARPTGIIASGQGFFIDGITTGNVTFNNSMRVDTGNNQFFRNEDTKIAQEEADRVWLDLSNNKGAFNQLLVGFMDGATDGFDRAFDGLKFGGGWVSFYSVANDQNLAVQGKKPLVENEIVPLGFASFVEEGEILKIEIANVEGQLNSGEFEIFLKDKVLNIVHDLSSEAYEFSINEKGVFNDRFELMINKTGTLSTDDIIANDQLIVNSSDGQLHVSTSKNSVISSFRVFDILGKLIINESPRKNQFTINTRHINKGTILLINAILEDNREFSKKIILH